jgi:hypothetical protein
MADNIGLGEAIAGQTRATGDWGAPVTRGLQMAEARDMKKMQLEQQKAYKQQQAAERMAKHMTAQDGKFHNSKYQKQFGEFYQQALPEMMQAEQSGDILTYSKKQNEITNELGRLKMVDTDEHELNRAKLAGSVTAGPAQEVYNKGGYQGLLADNQIHVVPLANVDPDSGHFTITDIKDPMLRTKFDYSIRRKLKTIADTKGVKSVNGVPRFIVDPNSKEYKDMRAEVIDETLRDPAVLRSEMATDEFRKFYEDYHNRTGIDYAVMKDPSLELPKITEEYLNRKYDSALSLNNEVRFGPNAPKPKENYDPNMFIGGKNKGNFSFTPNPDGTISTDDYNKSGIMLRFNGSISGLPVAKNAVQGIINPNIKYLGNDKFMVTGRPEGKGPTKTITLVVDKSEITSRYNLTDYGLEYYLGYTAGAPGTAPAASTSAPSAPVTTSPTHGDVNSGVKQTKAKTVKRSTLKSLVGTKGYEGYSEQELLDYYKSQGYTVK